MQIKSLRTKDLRLWFSKPKWSSRLTLYSFILLPLVIIRFSYCGFLHTDVDSARYMLSALLQSEATIFALVITLSLVAIQLAASTYSVRVIDAFKKTPDFRILIVIYAFALIYGFWVLKLIEEMDAKVNSLSNLENHISHLYYIGVFAFIAVIPCIWSILNLLKPSTIIELLAKEITKQSLLLAAMEEKNKKGKVDRIQPIIDIIHSSLMKYDYTTLRDGLRAITERIINIIENETFTDAEEDRVAKLFFFGLRRIGVLAINGGDEDSITEILNCISDIGETAVKRNFRRVIVNAIISLGELQVAAANKNLEVEESLAALFIANLKKDLN